MLEAALPDRDILLKICKNVCTTTTPPLFVEISSAYLTNICGTFFSAYLFLLCLVIKHLQLKNRKRPKNC